MASTQSAAVLQGRPAPRSGPQHRQNLQRLVQLLPDSLLQAQSGDEWMFLGNLQIKQCSDAAPSLTLLQLAGQRGVVEGVDWQPLAKHFDVTFFSSPHDMGTVRCGLLSGHSDSRQLSMLVALQRLACLQEWLHSPASALRLEVPPQLASSVFLLGKRCTSKSHILCSGG